MKRAPFLALLILLVLGGCLLKPWKPVPDPVYSVEDRYAVIQTDSLEIYIRPQVYSGGAVSVAGDYFPVWLRVKNVSRHKISLDSKSFSILAGGKQFDYKPLQVLLSGIQLLYLLGKDTDPFNTSAVETQQQALQIIRDQINELVDDYFSFGDILPGGVKEGYLFYNDKVGTYNEFELDALGHKVAFVR